MLLLLLLVIAMIELDPCQCLHVEAMLGNQHDIASLILHCCLQVVVLRDGRRDHISKHDLVVGDVVYLSAGDVIPADGVIFQKVAALCCLLRTCKCVVHVIVM